MVGAPPILVLEALGASETMILVRTKLRTQTIIVTVKENGVVEVATP